MGERVTAQPHQPPLTQFHNPLSVAYGNVARGANLVFKCRGVGGVGV